MMRYFAFNTTFTGLTLCAHISLLNNQTIYKGISGDGNTKEKRGTICWFFEKKRSKKRQNS